MADGKLIAVYGKSNHWWEGVTYAKFYDEDGRFGRVAEKELQRWKYMAELIDLPQKPVNKEIPYIIELLWGIKDRKELSKAIVRHRCGECDGCKGGDKRNPCSDRNLLRQTAIEHGLMPLGGRVDDDTLLCR